MATKVLNDRGAQRLLAKVAAWVKAQGYLTAQQAVPAHKHGLVHSDLCVSLVAGADTDFSAINSPYYGFVLKSIRTNGTNECPWLIGRYSSGIAFGGADTKGVLSLYYNSPLVKFAGGNGTKPVWWLGLTGAKDTVYDLSKFLTQQSLADYVTLDGEQSIAGAKEFIAALTVQSVLRITSINGNKRLLMGNQNGAGENKPAVIDSSNGMLRFGYGDSWTGMGGTFTEIASVSSSGLLAKAFKKSGGTDSQVLMADGSVQTHWKAEQMGNATADYGMITPKGMRDWTNKAFVTALGTSGLNLTWTKNGVTSNITVPYATTADFLRATAQRNLLPSDIGGGRMRLGMLQYSHLGLPGSSYWYDSLWISGYSAGDVKLSSLLAFSKGGTKEIYLLRQDHDAETWDANPARLLHSQNYADVLDSRYYTESETDTKLQGKLSTAGTQDAVFDPDAMMVYTGKTRVDGEASGTWYVKITVNTGYARYPKEIMLSAPYNNAGGVIYIRKLGFNDQYAYTTTSYNGMNVQQMAVETRGNSMTVYASLRGHADAFLEVWSLSGVTVEKLSALPSGVTLKAVRRRYVSGQTEVEDLTANVAITAPRWILGGKGSGNAINAGSNDAANAVGGEPGNVVITSWNGVSFTTSFQGSEYCGKNAVSIDCRTGKLYAKELRAYGGYMWGPLKFGSDNALIKYDSHALVFAADDGVNKVVIDGESLRRSGSAPSLTLGTAAYPWANLYATSISVSTLATVEELYAERANIKRLEVGENFFITDRQLNTESYLDIYAGEGVTFYNNVNMRQSLTLYRQILLADDVYVGRSSPTSRGALYFENAVFFQASLMSDDSEGEWAIRTDGSASFSADVSAGSLTTATLKIGAATISYDSATGKLKCSKQIVQAA